MKPSRWVERPDPQSPVATLRTAMDLLRRALGCLLIGHDMRFYPPEESWETYRKSCDRCWMDWELAPAPGGARAGGPGEGE